MQVVDHTKNQSPVSLSNCESANFYQFPMSKADQSSIILHHPTNVWGFGDRQLVIAITTSHPDILMYTWYRNGISYREGFNYCCLALSDEGEYSVKVQCNKREEVSDAVSIVKRNIITHMPSDCQKSSEKKEALTLVDNDGSENFLWNSYY